MILTDYIIEKANGLLKAEPEQTDSIWSMFNSGSVEIEVGEFLYSLVRVQKPNHVLETGTHEGISALYMALALKDNGKGILDTVGSPWFESADRLWETFEVKSYVRYYCQDSLKFEPKSKYDIVFLDTEPHLRFDELHRFYSSVESGGLIFIHDLNENLGLNFDTMIQGVYHYPFGDFRTRFGYLILRHELTVVHLNSPRGLTMFQKFDSKNSVYKFLKGELLEEGSEE